MFQYASRSTQHRLGSARSFLQLSMLLSSLLARRRGMISPGAYKDVRAVVDAAEGAGLARKVAKLSPLICIKG